MVEQPKQAARVVHHVPGRLRLEMVGARNPAQGHRLAETLSKEPGVSQVRFTPASRSLVVHFDPECTSSKRLLDGLHSIGAIVLESLAAPDWEQGLIDTVVPILEDPQNPFGIVNQMLDNYTGGVLDLPRALSIALALAALVDGGLTLRAAGGLPWKRMLAYLVGAWMIWQGDQSVRTSDPAEAAPAQAVPA